MSENSPGNLANPNGPSIENYLDTYRIQAEWIRFADAKAGAVLTANAALVGLVAPSIRGSFHGPYSFVFMILFFGLVGCAVLSGLFSFCCINPFRRKGKHPVSERRHFHTVAIVNHYGLDDVDKFIADSESNSVNNYKQEVLAAILFDAHISNAKYSAVRRSIRFLLCTASIAVVYYVFHQIMLGLDR